MLTEFKTEHGPVMINMDHVVMVVPRKNGCDIHTITDYGPHPIRVKTEYENIKRAIELKRTFEGLGKIWRD